MRNEWTLSEATIHVQCWYVKEFLKGIEDDGRTLADVSVDGESGAAWVQANTRCEAIEDKIAVIERGLVTPNPEAVALAGAASPSSWLRGSRNTSWVSLLASTRSSASQTETSI